MAWIVKQAQLLGKPIRKSQEALHVQLSKQSVFLLKNQLTAKRILVITFGGFICYKGFRPLGPREARKGEKRKFLIFGGKPCINLK